MKRHFVLRAGLLVLLMALPYLSCRAVLPPSFTWTGTSPDSDELFDPDNWAGNVAPPNDGTAEFVFGNARRTYTHFNNELRAYRLSFSGHARSYYLEKIDDTLTTYIGSGGIFYNPLYATVRSTIDDSVVLTADQTWDIQKGSLLITGLISGSATLTKTGIGNLVLDSVHSDDWLGGLILSQGGVVVRANMEDGALITRGLGTGPLTFNGGALIAEGSNYDYDYDYTELLLENQIISQGQIFTKNRVPLYFVTDYEGSGGVRLEADTTIRTQGAPLYIESNITESGGARRLTVNADGMVVLSGGSGWTGGTQVDKGILIFAGEDNTPGISSDITIGSSGYAGIGVDNNTGLFVSEINPGSAGTIGFDSDPEEESAGPFSAPVDLTNLPNIRLGSATEAILTGTITPPDNVYRFGGGGGFLWVNSELTGNRAVNVTSLPEHALTLLLGNIDDLPLPVNNFSGGVTVANSAVIFFPGTQPATGNYTLQGGGYIGIADPDTTAQTNFLARFPGTTNTGIIGFDDMDWTEVTIALNFSQYAPGVYFGTHSDVTLSGAITPATDSVYRFAAYKGGFLEVASELTGSNAVHIGDPNSLGTFGDPLRDEISTVVLSGGNSYSGTTTLYTGRLIVGQSNGVVGTDPTTALGTGALVVQPHNISVPEQFDDDDLFPELSAENRSYNTIIPNAIQLNSGLYIGDNGESEFTLAGNISGAGKLIVTEDTYLTLAGDNTFSGGIYLKTWAGLTIASNTATGTGPLGFGGGRDTSTHVHVATDAPVIHGLYSRDEHDYTYIHLDEDDTVFTVIQPTGVSRFIGNIHSDSTNRTARFVKDGPGTLRLHGYLGFDGLYDEARDSNISAEIRAGTLLFSRNNYDYDEGYYGYLGYDKVLLSGGTLALDYQTTLENPLITEAGRLAGYGAFYSHVTIGNGVTVSPGLAEDNPVGQLQFDELTLAPAGIYEWNIMAVPSGAEFSLVWDHINIGSLDTLFITATEESPFSIRIISLAANGQPGVIDGFVAGDFYSATIISSYSIDPENTFSAAKFSLDVSQFQTNLGAGVQAGSFSLTLDDSNLVLNFTAVPEPSTYALMLVGLGFVGWTVWRRRRC